MGAEGHLAVAHRRGGQGALLPTEEARGGWWEGRGAEWAGGKV